MKLSHRFRLFTKVLILGIINAIKVLKSGDTYHVSICPISPYAASCNAQVVTDSIVMLKRRDTENEHGTRKW